MERRMGLDQPMAVQYWRYLRGLFRGDLGESHITGRPVLEDLVQRVPATLELTLAALLVALAAGIPLGVVAAVRRDGWLDHVSRLVGVGGWRCPRSGPACWLYVFLRLGVAPPSGPTPRHRASLARRSPGS
jgi:peptide/nickel transport system permease protein